VLGAIHHMEYHNCKEGTRQEQGGNYPIDYGMVEEEGVQGW